MTGYIYFVQRGDFGSIKVGYSTDVETRVISLQTGSDIPLRVRGVVKGNKAQEAQVHKILGPYRKLGEWFMDSPFLKEFIAAAVAFGIEEAIVSGEEHVARVPAPKFWRPKAFYRRGGRVDLLKEMQETLDNF